MSGLAQRAMWQAGHLRNRFDEALVADLQVLDITTHPATYGGRTYDVSAWWETVAEHGMEEARDLAHSVGVYGPYEVRFPARAFLALTEEMA